MKFNTKRVLSIASSLIIAAQQCYIAMPACAVDTISEAETYADEIGLELNSSAAEEALSDLIEINDSELSIDVNDDNNVRQINGTLSDETVDSSSDAKAIIANTAELLGIDNVNREIRIDRVTESEYNKIYLFKQYYQGLEMLNSYVKVVVNKTSGEAKFLNSSVVSDFSIDTSPSITAQQAVDDVIAVFGQANCTPGKLSVYSTDNESFRLVWAVNTDLMNAETVYVDAVSGEVIVEDNMRLDTAKNGHEIKSNNILMSNVNRILPGNVKSFKIDIAKDSGKYKLHDMKRNTYIIINDKVDSRDVIMHYLGYYEAYTTNDSSFTSNNDEQLGVAVLYNFERAYDFYKNNFSYSGYDGNNAEIFIIPNYKDHGRKPLANALAMQDSQGRYLAFGEGDGIDTRSFGSDLDTVTHEYTHCISDHKLDWNNSSGETIALDEAFSDIMGEYADTTREWIHGTDRIIGSKNSAAYKDLRNFTKEAVYSKAEIDKIPTNTDESGKKRYKDGMCVRHAAYWMDHLGIDSATAAKLWFYALDYLPEGSNAAKFTDMRNALLQAVNDVVDPRGRELTRKKIKIAFNKVHIYDTKELPGDLCNDGRLDSFDLTVMRKYLAGQQGFNISQAAQADLNYDGEVTSADLSILQNYLMGRIKDF